MLNSKISHINRKSLIFKIFEYSLLLYFLQSLYAWFIWGDVLKSIVLSICLITCLLVLFYIPEYFNKTKNNLIITFIFAIALFYSIRDSFGLPTIRAVFQVIIIGTIIALNDLNKQNILNFITKWFALITFISLVGWILFLANIPLPHSYLTNQEFGYYFDNYYIFLNNRVLIFPRYSSIFLEPGHYGMIAVFLLFANRFQLKRKELLIIFFGVIFSFSLAAYILSVISIMILFITDQKRKIIKILTISFLLIGLFVFFKTYNNGNNPINNLILNRLELKNGTIAGNNRFSSDFDEYFHSYMNNDKKWLGLGKQYRIMQWDKGNAGYKVFLVEHGIIGTLLVSLFYSLFFLIQPSHKKKIVFSFLLIYLLCFLQAAYPFWFCELIIYITGISALCTNINENEQ